MSKKVKTKICTICGKEKFLDEFHNYKRGKYGRKSQCKFCVNARDRKKYYSNIEKSRARVRNWGRANSEYVRAAQIRRNFGVTLEEYDNYYSKTLKEQQGCCAKCGIHYSEKRLVLDHDHSKFGVEAFRGLLCDNCNCGMGLLGDNLEGLMEAVDYLKRYNPFL